MINEEFNLDYLYVGLLKPGKSGLEEIHSIKNTNYQRVEICPLEWQFFNSELLGPCLTNDVPVAFPLSSSPWGEITHFGIFNKLFFGDLLVAGALDNHIIIEENTGVVFSVGKLVVTLKSIMPIEDEE